MASSSSSSSSSSDSGQVDAQGIDLSLSASGWLMLWQLGVAHALQRHMEPDALKASRFAGSSGGAAVASCLALEIDAQRLADFMLRCCHDWHKDPLRKVWGMREYAKACIERCMHEATFKHENLQEGKLNVQVTLLPSLKGKLVSKFASNEEFLEAVLGSCTMSPVAGWPFALTSEDKELNGKFVCDGGMTAILPQLGPNTVNCTPLYPFDAAIKPSRYVPVYWAALPPSVKEMQELFWLGAHDGLTWLQKEGRVRALTTSPCAWPTSANKPRIKPIHERSPTSALSSSLSLGNTSPVEHAIALDASRSGAALSYPREKASRVADSVAMGLARNCVKPIALAAVYTELWSRAAVAAANTGLALVENKRREAVTSKGGLLSLRRWVHSEMIGSTDESWKAARSYAGAASDPLGWLQHLPVLDQMVEGKKAKAKLEQHSVVYRFLLRRSVLLSN